MALSCLSNRSPLQGSCDPQLELTDSLMGFICEQLDNPEFDIGALLNTEPTTQHNANPQPPLLPTLNSSPIATNAVQYQHQNPYHTNAPSSCYPTTSAEFSSSAFLKYHQTCNNHLSTAYLTNQVNVMYRNLGFPVRPYTGTGQGMLVPPVECASAQSVAARVRRKKISEKTQELAKLIPGGTRMNTAEMLLASFKYVKFLQAQIGILAMMDLEEAREIPLMVEEYMCVLLGSTNMQGHLSANGKCLVPKKLAMNLSKEMKSNVVVSRDLSRFVESIGR